MKKLAFLMLLMLSLAFKVLLLAPDQVAPENSKVTFSVSHVSGRVKGTFTGLQGTVVFDENNLSASTMDVSLDANSIDTDNRARDKDLRNTKFFNVAVYPRVHFKSKEITKAGDAFQVRGDLTIKDQTREMVIPFQVKPVDNGRLFTGEFTLNRKDFNLGKGSFPPIGKVVTVNIEAIVK